MLRFTSSMEDGFCTMEREAENAVNYMELMKERYEDLFEYEVHMDQALSDVRIPKLMIQPVCENCLKTRNRYGKSGFWFMQRMGNGL